MRRRILILDNKMLWRGPPLDILPLVQGEAIVMRIHPLIRPERIIGDLPLPPPPRLDPPPHTLDRVLARDMIPQPIRRQHDEVPPLPAHPLDRRLRHHRLGAHVRRRHRPRPRRVAPEPLLALPHQLLGPLPPTVPERPRDRDAEQAPGRGVDEVALARVRARDALDFEGVEARLVRRQQGRGVGPACAGVAAQHGARVADAGDAEIGAGGVVHSEEGAGAGDGGGEGADGGGGDGGGGADGVFGGCEDGGVEVLEGGADAGGDCGAGAVCG